MSPEIFLFPGVVTDRYCFMQTVKKELNLAMMDTYYRLMRTDLVYDRETKEVSEYVLYNDDFTKEVPIANLVEAISSRFSTSRSSITTRSPSRGG